MKTLIVLRATPGAGKSTLAKTLQQGFKQSGLTCSIRSTDDQFMIDGKYVFDRNLLFKHHTTNIQLATQDMIDNVNVVIIDNTNINHSDYKSYVEAAKQYGYDVSILKLTVDLDTCKKRNNTRSPDRKIPDEVIDRMFNNLKLST